MNEERLNNLEIMVTTNTNSYDCVTSCEDVLDLIEALKEERLKSKYNKNYNNRFLACKINSLEKELEEERQKIAELHKWISKEFDRLYTEKEKGDKESKMYYEGKIQAYMLIEQIMSIHTIDQSVKQK